jgi:hypothetical protein
MRRLFLALSFILPACIGDTDDVINGAVNNSDSPCGTSADGADPLCTDANEYVNITEDCVTCPRIMVPASAVKPEVHIVEDFKLSADEQSCPSTIIDQSLLERTFVAFIDESNADKFDAWQGSAQMTGDAVEATWSHEGIYYKAFWIDNERSADPGIINIWERTDGPFDMGFQHQIEYEGTYADVNFTGCANFGIAWQAEPGKMQLSHEGDPNYDWGLEYHNDWQQRYARAVTGLATVLGVK